MDSLTQAVLGGAVGYAVGGRRLGRPAAGWGAVLGTVPDLDVLAYPWLDTAGELLVHRGVTHGLAFSLVAGPLFGWMLAAAERGRRTRGAPSGAAPDPRPGSGWAWTTVAVLALVTHPLLDVCTVYGTQLLAPFSRRPFATGSVFIIDPLYTLPLMACLGVSVVRQRPRWATAGLAVSTLYLAWGLGAQAVVDARAARAWPGAAQRLVTPMPLQSLYWRIEVLQHGQVASYTHALVRPDVFWPAAPVAPRAEFPASLRRTRGVATLQWFSRGWLVRPTGAPPALVADARFGQGPDGQYVFRWKVGPEGRIEAVPLAARLSGAALRDLVRGALGHPPGPVRPVKPYLPPATFSPTP